jgi:arylsulfatase A-like enzyme
MNRYRNTSAVCSLVCVFVGSLTGAFLGLRPVLAETTAVRPNVLLVYTDDQSYRTLSCYRDEGAWPWANTPNIDRLAREGVRFTAAYGASWCSPSRACLLTGRLPHGIEGVHLRGVTFRGQGCDPEVARFWPAELRRAGYRTALVGKWHLGQDAGHGRYWGHSVVWDQNTPQGDWYNDQALSIDGAPPAVVPGYSTDVFTQRTIDFLRRERDRPWFVWLCYNAPHLPNTVHPRHRNLYADAEVLVPDDIFGPRPGKPRWAESFTQWRRAADAAGRGTSVQALPNEVRAYNRLVAAVDDGLGQIFDALRESGQLDRTVIIFASDQGFAWGEHGFRWKVGPYDACLKMPLIVWSGDAAASIESGAPSALRRGGVCRHPVTIVDVAPTVLGLAGVALPWSMHGHDLRPLLAQPDADWPHPAVMEHTRWEFGSQTDRGVTGEAATGGVPWWIFLRDGRYKYIRTLVPDEIEELYDLQSDPQERNNLAVKPAERQRLEAYRRQLVEYLRTTGAGLVEKLPAPRVIPEAK